MPIKARFRRSRDLQKDTTTSLATTETKNRGDDCEPDGTDRRWDPQSNPLALAVVARAGPYFSGYEIGVLVWRFLPSRSQQP